MFMQPGTAAVGNVHPDNSANYAVPGSESFIPGRVIFARRQALEYHRLRLALQRVPHPDPFVPTPRLLTGAAVQALQDLIADAIHECHDDDSCVGERATPDDVSSVIHDWLDEGWDDLSSCDSPASLPYSGNNTKTSDALNMQPWRQ